MTESERPEPISLERWTVTSGSNVNSRAAVVLHAGRQDWQASTEGNGPVDALLRAVDEALADVLGGHPLLLGFDVHALAEGPSAEGRVTVRIAPPATATGQRAGGRYSGEMASTNIESWFTSRAGVEAVEKIEVEEVAAHVAQELKIPAAATRYRRGTRDFTWTAFQVFVF